MKQKQSILTGRVRLKLQFFTDGRAEKTTSRAKGSEGDFTEKGKWFVNKKCALCMMWDVGC